jgi:hypothetical protein
MGKAAKGNNKGKLRTKNSRKSSPISRQAYANCNQRCLLRRKILAPLLRGLASLVKNFPVYSSQASGFPNGEPC